MSWFNRKKKLFLIKLMAVLGYGGMAAYCIGGCDSKPAQNESPKSVETNNSKPPQNEPPKSVETKNNTEKTDVPSESEYLEFNIEYFPADAKLTVRNNGRYELICEHSPCHYRFEASKIIVGATLSAPGYNRYLFNLSKNNDIHLTPTIHIELREYIPNTDLKPKKPEFKYLAAY